MLDSALVVQVAAVIEFLGSCLISYGVIHSLLRLLRGAGIDEARLVMVGAVLSGLGFKTAATLLKAIELGSWRGIAMFASIFMLRTCIKQLFLWERRRLLMSSQS